MTIDQLEAFLAVVKFSSFHLAAEKLYLTQPTVTSEFNRLKENSMLNCFRKMEGVLSYQDMGSFLSPMPSG
ncbi:LysR family transcriptional regulator [Terrilactibacillus sp. S3-3]|nr:LysR family transcriptional regulator [Terrilactibacillus sp. S3-3]